MTPTHSAVYPPSNRSLSLPGPAVRSGFHGWLLAFAVAMVLASLMSAFSALFAGLDLVFSPFGHSLLGVFQVGCSAISSVLLIAGTIALLACWRVAPSLFLWAVGLEVMASLASEAGAMLRDAPYVPYLLVPWLAVGVYVLRSRQLAATLNR